MNIRNFSDENEFKIYGSKNPSFRRLGRGPIENDLIPCPVR